MNATATGQWRRALDKLSDKELYELGERVDEVTKLPGWERIVAWIASGHTAVLRSLTSGSTQSHADQSRAIGYLAGLEEAPNVVQAIADAVSTRQQAAEQRAQAERQRASQEETP